jgi:hypothetical protein
MAMLTTTRNALKYIGDDAATDTWLTYRNGYSDAFGVIDASLAKGNFLAATDPGANDDEGDGYAAGSVWFNTTDGKIFVCLDASTTSADWKQVWPAIVTDMDLTDYLLADGTQAIESALKLTQIATPDAPAAGLTSIYAKLADGKIYHRPTGGSESLLCDASHDHSGGDGAAIVAAATSFSATAKVIGRKTAGAGAGEECSPSEILDLIGTAEQGDVLYRGSAAWALLPHGVAAGMPLMTGGHAANPTWGHWVPETAFTATPASTSTLTMTADKTGTIKVGCGLKYTIGGTDYYGIVTAIAANLLTVGGAPMGGDVTALYWCRPDRVIQEHFYIPSTFADASNTALLDSDANTAFSWGKGKAYLVRISAYEKGVDSGANKDRVNITIAGSAVCTSNTNAGLAPSSAKTWVHTVIDINTTNYDINKDEAIEVTTDANGSNGNATGLTMRCVFVLE